MRNGQVFELPMPTHHIKDSEYSSLPTPKARDHQAEGYEAGLRRASPQVGTIVKALVEGDERILLRSPKASEGQGGALGEAEARKRGNTVGVRDQVMDLVASQGVKVSRALVNLPTPTVSDLYTGNLASKQHSEGSLHSVSLAQIVNRPDLLPTPIVRDYKDGQSEVLRNGKVQTDTVGRAIMNSGEVSENRWGKFELAVRVWEQEIERKAPSPTKPDGKEGAHRLSSKFTEWMMGLPEGWITDVGLTRNEELKLAGNGVVPQQAELALRLLLENNEGQD
jgi:DNA (cytosine-5)-methyltransferase 1